METLDLATARVGEMSEQVDKIEQDLREQLADRDAMVAELAAKAKDLSGARAAKAAQVPAPLLTLYDKIRSRNNGVAIAKFDGRRCQGCGLEATVADVNRYMSAPSDEVIRCAECDRILVR
jgi:predicted  nucleic acid-binding Zn-ribbon protein